MAKVSKSVLLAKMKKRAKGAWKKSQKAETKVKGQTLPDGIVRGVARLSSYKFDSTKKGDPYFSITGIVVEPEELAGARASIQHFIKATQQKTVQDKLDGLSSDMQLLGCEVEGTDIDDLPQILQDRCDEKPYFYFNTWKPPADKRNPNPSTLVFIQGIAEDYEGAEEDEEEVEDEEDNTEEEEEEEEEESEEEEAEEEEGEEEEEEKKPRKKPKPAAGGKGGKKPPRKKAPPAEESEEEEGEEEEEEESEEEEEGSEEWTPAKGEVYLYKATPKGKAEEVEVKAVNTEKETVKVQRVRDEKVFANVPWTALQGE